MRLNRVFLLSLLLIAAAGCTTSKLPKTLPIAKASDVPISTGPSLYLVNVNIDVSGTGTQAGTAQLSFDNTRSTTTLQTVCSGATDSTTTATRPCVCKFSWQEINSTSGTNIPVKRNIQTKVTAVQPYGVTCASPDKTVYTNEILDGTPLSITLAPAAGNNSVFTVNTITMTKSTSAVSGSFQDQQGHYFDNILRYTCYEQFKRGMSISSFLATATTDSGDIKFPLASRFCLTKADGTANAYDCYGIDTIQNSSQAYYYNLYVRDSERGSINPGNARYICPKVQEYLPGASAALSNAWPLDTSFALSLDHTESFPIGVEAFTKVSNGTDPTSQGSRCFKTATGSSSSRDGLINSCLGFAAKPNKDGTCPSFFDKAQRERPTFRLRRYISLYPQVFNTNGAPMDQTQSTDTVYVLDRPVKGPSSSTTTKPFTMRGPKPCPFSFFDHSGVTGIPAPRANEYPKDILPGYVATNNSSWRGKNIDGIEFPNTDTRNSCSAALTVLNSDHTVLSIATVNAANPVYPHAYIRPIQPWAPHYVEDTEFLACAPKPDPE
ncbi:MAG TPA: hypothetical protein DCS07_11575, partial [Bdellovibrionales bacterium]|nr:hypothetical protein [Bdellovibrionales bacterium]